MMALTNGADVSTSAFEPQEDILNIDRDYSSQNIITDNKLG